jgi:hypothetical protein
MKSSPNKVLSIINEEINIFETEISVHSYQRIKERLNSMTTNNDITPQEAANIERNLSRVINYDFKPDKSYGILLGKFNINPSSTLVTTKHKSGTYYEINSADQHDIVKDSTGNEFWGIIRENRLVTVFLRKTIQRQTAEQPRDMGGLGVDTVIDNFEKYLQNIDSEKQLQQQKELEKQQQKVLRINGVWWEIDNDNQRIYKKNNPNVFVHFNDILDYPEWNDEIKDEILNMVVGQKTVQR